MNKVEAIIRPDRLQAVQDALDELGASGLTITEVLGCGAQRGYTETYRGTRANISLQRKVKVEWQGKWWDGVLESQNGGKYCVHYVGYDDSWNECVPRARVTGI